MNKPELRPVTCGVVNNALQALKANALVASTLAPPCLLPAGDRPNLLAVANGLLDLNTRELRPHTPDYFSTVCLPYAYEEAATAPAWEAVLDRSLEGDRERIALVQEMFGYCLTLSTDAQAFFVLAGPGGNGKSVVCALLRATVGRGNYSAVPLEAFQGRFALAVTLGRTVNVCSEVGELDKTAEGVLKAFTSGDAMFFERKGKDGFAAVPTAKLVFATNNVPRFSDKSEGIWRRMVLIPMTATIPPGERVAGLDKEAHWEASGELPGVLNWALDGLARLKANGWRFTESAVCKAALEEHRLESNPARAFLVEGYKTDPEASPIKSAELYQAYGDYCAANGFRCPLSHRKFSQEVIATFKMAPPRLVKQGGVSARVWDGIRPVDPVRDDPQGLRLAKAN
jgi:P4 family phage/plasmid primase-like protien